MFNITIEKLSEELVRGPIAIQTRTKDGKKYYCLATLVRKGNWDFPKDTDPFKIEGEVIYGPVMEGTTIAFGAFVEEKVMLELLNWQPSKEKN